jgi:hypothetical protein
MNFELQGAQASAWAFFVCENGICQLEQSRPVRGQYESEETGVPKRKF